MLSKSWQQMAKTLKFDEVGYWSEIKLDIVKQYAVAYSKIMVGSGRFRHCYIDAFSGAGKHVRKKTGEMILGSPLNALEVTPPFSAYWFIDLDAGKIDYLKAAVGPRTDVEILSGDCNEVLLSVFFPRVTYASFSRALCLIDPYGLHLDWRVLKAAGASRTIEIFLNFPVADMNRNVLWRNPQLVAADHIERMNRFWGDESWRQAAYDTSGDLFGNPHKTDNDSIAEAFRQRLEKVAGFKYVPLPIPMRNSQGATVYYLFFASENKTGARIVTWLFDKYRNRGSLL